MVTIEGECKRCRRRVVVDPSTLAPLSYCSPECETVHEVRELGFKLDQMDERLETLVREVVIAAISVFVVLLWIGFTLRGRG